MRVGLLSPIAPEKIGGGYTFEQEIFERILELAPGSKHEFVIFEGFRGAKAGTKSPGFKYVPLQRPRFDFLVPRKRRFPWEFKWIDKVLEIALERQPKSLPDTDDAPPIPPNTTLGGAVPA